MTENTINRVVKYFKPEVLPHQSEVLAVLKEDITLLCQNCDSSLQGEYCHNCSQKNFKLRRPIWFLLEDMLGDLFSFDSRFFNSFILLLFKPGQMTKEYNQGKRMSFVPPFRQYLVISILFFVCLVNFTTPDIDVGNSTEIQKGIDKTIEKLPVEQNNLGQTTIEWLTEILTGVKMIIEKPKLLNQVISEWVPRAMIVMVPLFALLLKSFYVFKGRFYIEHLIFSLHFHAFIFLHLTLIILVGHFIPSFTALYWAYFYIPLYLAIALWVNYENKIFTFILRGGAITFCYSILLISILFFIMAYGTSKL